MNRLKLIVFFLMKGDVRRAEMVIYNYYAQEEKYKRDDLKTLELISKMIDGKYASFDDIKRSINVIETVQGDTWATYKHSKLDKWYERGEAIMHLGERYNRTVEELHGHLLNFELRFNGVVLDYGEL